MQVQFGCGVNAPRPALCLQVLLQRVHVQPEQTGWAGPRALQAQQRFRERQRAKLQEASTEYDKLAEEVERLRLENSALAKQVCGDPKPSGELAGRGGWGWAAKEDRLPAGLTASLPPAGPPRPCQQ